MTSYCHHFTRFEYISIKLTAYSSESHSTEVWCAQHVSYCTGGQALGAGGLRRSNTVNPDRQQRAGWSGDTIDSSRRTTAYGRRTATYCNTLADCRCTDIRETGWDDFRVALTVNRCDINGSRQTAACSKKRFWSSYPGPLFIFLHLTTEPIEEGGGDWVNTVGSPMSYIIRMLIFYIIHGFAHQ